MTCKDCIHYEACHDMYYEEHATRHFDPEKHNAEKECGYFKDRSRFVELPCKVGDILFVPTRNFISEYKIDYFHVGAYGIWFNTTLIAGISTHLRSENIESIGKTVFLTREEAEQVLKERESNE